MKLYLLPTSTIVIALSLLESTASSKLHRIRSSSDDDVGATTYTHTRSLLIDEMPDVDVLLIGGSSLSMSFSYTYHAYNNDDNNNNNTTLVLLVMMILILLAAPPQHF
jgi:hypothetical protein